MNQQQLNDEIRRFVTSKRVTKPINLTFNQKHSVNGFKVDDVVSERNFRHFKNKLNTKLFGNGYRRFNKSQIEMMRSYLRSKRNGLRNETIFLFYSMK